MKRLHITISQTISVKLKSDPCRQNKTKLHEIKNKQPQGIHKSNLLPPSYEKAVSTQEHK